MEVIKVKDVSKFDRHGKVLLDKVNLEIEGGITLCLIGPHNSGKTSLRDSEPQVNLTLASEMERKIQILRGDYANRQEEKVNDIMAQNMSERRREMVQEGNLAGRMGKEDDLGK